MAMSRIARAKSGRPLRRKIYNAVFVGFCLVATLVAITSLTLILWSLLSNGLGGLNLDIFTKDTAAVGSQGGLRNAIVGSLMMLGLAMAIALVVGILAGTWLSEFGGETTYGHAIRFLNDVLLSAPSILIGLAVSVVLVVPFHHFSGLAGSVALALLATPVVTRTTEDILALQSQALREAGSALGTPQWLVVRRIIWRSAGGGLLTGGLLAFARISGETAPLLLTSLSNNFFSWNMLGEVANLPTVIYDRANTAYPDWRTIAWVGALLITAAVLTVNVVGRIIAREPRQS
jgi:phosphate transport system permease protein